MIKHRKRHAANNTEDFSVSSALIIPLKFTLLFLLLGAAIVMIASLILFNTPNPTEYLEYAGKVCLYLSVLIVGIVLGKRHKSKLFLMGIVLSAYIVVFLVTVSLFLPSSGTSLEILWLLLIPLICVLGCFIGGKATVSPRKRKRKYK